MMQMDGCCSANSVPSGKHVVVCQLTRLNTVRSSVVETSIVKSIRSSSERIARGLVHRQSQCLVITLLAPGTSSIGEVRGIYLAANISKNLSPIALADIGLSPLMTS